MNKDPFTIQVFARDGDPEGVRIVERQNSSAKFFVFPRDKWDSVKCHDDLRGAGVYILTGHEDHPENPNDELPTVYVGSSDKITARINQHNDPKNGKAFWDRAVLFTANSNKLNVAHAKWLEYRLVKIMLEAKRSHMANKNSPKEPTISDAEKAIVNVFLREIRETLPIVGVSAFEKSPILKVRNDIRDDAPSNTIVVPAREEGFNRVFLGEDAWYAIRIGGGMLDKIRYIAAYQTSPVSAVTHYARVKSIEAYGDSGKYKIIFDGKAQKMGRPVISSGKPGEMQGSRYTSFSKLQKAKTIANL